MKKTIKLTESDLHRIVSESIEDVITETQHGNKDKYREFYIDEFNKNLSNILTSLNNARYSMGQILHGSSDSYENKWRILKQYGFYKSETKLREAYQLLNKVAKMVGSVKNDITGEYKNIEARNKYNGASERGEQFDYSGLPGWGE